LEGKIREMRVGLVHHNLDSRGGGEKVCVTVMELLRELGHEIHLVTVSPPNWESIKKGFGKEVYADKVYNLFPVKLKFFGIYQRLLTIIPAIRLKVDFLINTHGDVIPYFMPKRNIPSLYYCYFPVVALIKKEYPSKYQKGFWRIYFEPYRMAINYLMKKAMRTATKVITLSEFSKKAIKEIFNVDSEIIYPPVDTETFNKAFERKGERENLVLVLGRITKEKRQDLAIKAIPKLKNVKLAIVGSTTPKQISYFNYLKKLAKELNVENRVNFYPNASLEELLGIMSKAKVLLHTMKGEHFGIAIAEGMCAGLIPVVWDYGGQSEFMPKKYQFHSIEEIPEKIELALNASESEREEIHNFAQKFSEEKFKENFRRIMNEMIKKC
jgi:glycosyltransferase involved in cell wall biosynthesis